MVFIRTAGHSHGNNNNKKKNVGTGCCRLSMCLYLQNFVLNPDCQGDGDKEESLGEAVISGRSALVDEVSPSELKLPSKVSCHSSWDRRTRSPHPL